MKKTGTFAGFTAMATLLLTGWITGPINNFKTMKIGEQTWMAENLSVEKFQNGDPIPYAKTEQEWIKAANEKKPAWCYLLDDPKYDGTMGYGKLYNWYAVSDPRGLFPKGWRIPDAKDWDQLNEVLGKSSAGKQMKAKEGWGYSVNYSPCGFDALPAGSRYENGNFELSMHTYWWVNTLSDGAPLGTGVGELKPELVRWPFTMGAGLSVRLIKE